MPTTHLDPKQAGAQITRHNEQWGITLGTAYGPITYGFRSTSTTGSSTERTTFSKVNAAEMAAVDDAMRLWSNVANVTFTPVNPGGYTNSATILVANYSSSSDGAAAYAYHPSPGSTGPTNSAGDVWINAYYQSNLSPSPGNYAYMAILHEVGHALGLEHPGGYNAGPGVTITYAKNAEYVEDSRQYTVMSYFDASATGANHVYQGTTIRASTPLLHDIAAIQRLYGANTDYATGDTTYGFNSNADPAYRISSSTQQVVYCIWDGGGNDTLDASGYSTNQTIDLRAASFSDIGALTKNVSIAVGALIENAIGGSGNDSMIGNDVDNHLVGGNGNDRLTGNSGDDLLDGGAGFDTAIFQGLRATYTILTNGSDIRVFGVEGIDDLVGIEALQFSDMTVTLEGLLPTLGIADLAPSGAEGTGGTTSLTFTVILDRAALTAQTVDWAVSGSGAHGAGAADFAAGVLPTGVLTFAAGETSKTIAVAVSTDATVEFDEGFTVTLSNASSGSVIGTPAANGTILDDDKSAVSVAVLAADKAEGTGGTTLFTFTVSLDQAAVAAQSVGWAVTGFGDQPASAADFGGALPFGTLSFAAGETSKTIVVSVVGDTQVEPDEMFAVSLSNPSSGLGIGNATATGTIRNEDAAVAIALLSASPLIVNDDTSVSVAVPAGDLPEGDAGSTKYSFVLTLAGDSSVPHSVAYSVTGTGSNPASADDFAGGVLPSGVITFAPGETDKSVVVNIAGDLAAEPNESFAISLSGPSVGLAVVVATAVGTVRNDDMDAHDDAYVGLRGQALHVAATSGVLANDEGTVPTTAVLLSGPAHGSAALTSDGSFDYVPTAGFVGVDSFAYRATGANGSDDAQVLIYLTPVSGSTSVTLDLLALSAEQQIAATYTGFFGRGADAAGFAFWIDQFHTGLPVQGPAALFANIASAFGFSTEARNLYPFLADPSGATDGQIGAFIDSVYNNLFNRSSDSAGLAYWTGQVRQVVASGLFVGSVLVDIIGGAQNSAAGQDIATLIGKVAVNLEYVHEQQRLGTLWTAADDGAEASALIHGITADPRTVLVGIAQAQNLVLADSQG
ncbi:M10 family metallopeptidase C-terminal domain-containing protein [Reyranella sp.]|uniref:M10 family metallopeptidase C-terminal domain-containing protein n=1 Tax=Reyranella sp. TaxID=1929291 RepID=UPI0037838A44